MATWISLGGKWCFGGSIAIAATYSLSFPAFSYPSPPSSSLPPTSYPLLPLPSWSSTSWSAFGVELLQRRSLLGLLNKTDRICVYRQPPTWNGLTCVGFFFLMFQCHESSTHLVDAVYWILNFWAMITQHKPPNEPLACRQPVIWRGIPTVGIW